MGSRRIKSDETGSDWFLDIQLDEKNCIELGKIYLPKFGCPPPILYPLSCFCWKVRWSYSSKGSMWLVCLIVLNGVGHKNWRVRNSTMYRTVQRNFDLQPFTLKTKRLLRHITRWCTSHKVTIRYYVNRKLYSILLNL